MSTCKRDISQCLSNSAVECKTDARKRYLNSEKLSRNEVSSEVENEKEIIVEIMPPCYGGIPNVNTIEGIESGGNSNVCYLLDEERSETATLLPKNSQNPQQQSDNESQGKSRNMMNTPKDSYNFVYGVFFLLGLSTLLPWNFFISINQFWDYRFRNVSATNFIYFVSEGNNSVVTDGNQTELQKEFTSYLSIGIILIAIHAEYPIFGIFLPSLE